MKTLKLQLVTVLALLMTGCQPASDLGLITPESLTCEYLTDPAVVDVPHPRLSWINKAPEGTHGQMQTAYQIRVASSIESLNAPDLWDSKQTQSIESTRIKYDGIELHSRQECYWQVRVWDSDGNPTEWSTPAFWRMGLLNKSDWKAQWIGAPWDGETPLPKPDGGPNGVPEDFGPPAPLLRKTFDASREVSKAVAFVTGLGYFELYVNGNKVGDDVLVPNQTNYGKRPGIETAGISVDDNFRKYKVMYLAYDVTSQLKTGKNTLGVALGNGFYNPAKFWTEGYGTPRFFGQLHITYSDGTEEVIVSDPSWKVAKGPIVRNMVYYGELYDAREEHDGWSTPDFDDQSWEQAVLRVPPYGDLVAHTAHPDKVMEQLKPVSIERLSAGRYKVDFGVEISGWVKLINVNGPAGHKIDISFNSNMYSGDNSYICSGKRPATYAPRFNWFVFSGIEIRNWPGDLSSDNLVAEAVNTYIEASAQFETSNPLVNQINTIWRRSQVDNMHGGIASDCPHRERSGYTGDGQVTCPTVMHNYDARNFYHKWVQDMLDAQDVETGYVPNGAPWQPGCGGGVAWGAAICIIPWEFYLTYGDRDMLEENYTGMKEYIRYMLNWVDKDGIMLSQRRNYKDELVKWYNLGEWVAPGETIPDELVHTFYLWYCADITYRAATAIGMGPDAATYAELAAKTKDAFHKRFYDGTIGTYGDGGGNILALKMGVPKSQYNRVITALRISVEKNNGHLDTGIFGTRFFFEVLAENGMNDLAYAVMNKTTEPSFGHWIELGSTTTRERWDEGGSHNHPMFGGGLIWFYRNLAGMQTDEERPGYRHIIFKPQPVAGLDHVSYQVKTSYGDGGIVWKTEDNLFTMSITVPTGCTATVFVPTKEDETVSVPGGMDDKHITPGPTGSGFAQYEVQSGNYTFEVR